MRWSAILILLLLSAEAGAEDDPVKTFLKSVGKSFAQGSASGIASHFPEKGKVELRLKGLKSGSYRKAQAKSLLTTWFKAMEPDTCELKTVKGLVGRFKFRYKLRADAAVVEGTISVNLRKEGETWLIVGIVKS